MAEQEWTKRLSVPVHIPEPERALLPMRGCGNHHCRVVDPGPVATNGPCRCDTRGVIAALKAELALRPIPGPCTPECGTEYACPHTTTPSTEWITERLADYKACRSHREIAAIESMFAQWIAAALPQASGERVGVDEYVTFEVVKCAADAPCKQRPLVLISSGGIRKLTGTCDGPWLTVKAYRVRTADLAAALPPPAGTEGA